MDATYTQEGEGGDMWTGIRMQPPHVHTLPTMTGAQKVENEVPTFIMARASRPIAAPVFCQSVRLNDMPVVIGNANLVVWVAFPRLLISLATPVEASDHQLYAGTPSPLIGDPPLFRFANFSCNVSRETASAARTSRPSVGLQNGIAWYGSDVLRHGLKSSAHPSSLKDVHGGGGGGGGGGAGAGFGSGTGDPLHV